MLLNGLTWRGEWPSFAPAYKESGQAGRLELSRQRGMRPGGSRVGWASEDWGGLSMDQYSQESGCGAD